MKKNLSAIIVLVLVLNLLSFRIQPRLAKAASCAGVRASFSSATNVDGTNNSSGNPQDVVCNGGYGPTVSGSWTGDTSTITDVSVWLDGLLLSDGAMDLASNPLYVTPYMPNAAAGAHSLYITFTTNLGTGSSNTYTFYTTRATTPCTCTVTVTGNLNSGSYTPNGSNSFTLVGRSTDISGTYTGSDLSYTVVSNLNYNFYVNGSAPNQTVNGQAWPSAYTSTYDGQTCTGTTTQALTFTIPIITNAKLQLQ